MANEPLPKYYRRAYQDFSEGLNVFNDPLQLNANEFSRLDGFIVNDTGLLETVKGRTSTAYDANLGTDFIRMLSNFKRGTTVDQLVFAVKNAGNANSTYKVDLLKNSDPNTRSFIGHTTGTASFTNGNTDVTGSGTLWLSHLKTGDKIKANVDVEAEYVEILSVNTDTSITLASAYAGTTTVSAAYIARIILQKDSIPQATVFNNNLVVVDGFDTPMVYDSSTVDLITDAQVPHAKFVENHKSRLFMANTSSGPSTVYWSAVNNEDSWDPAALEPVFANDNGNICAIKSFADSLIVLKTNGKIYQVLGDFDQDDVGSPAFIRRVDIEENVGSIAGYTVVIGPDNKLYFLAETGIYSLDARMQIQKESLNIDNIIKDITFRSDAVTNKQFIFDTTNQWNGEDSGNSYGMVVRGGLLSPFMDRIAFSDAYKAYNSCSCYIDASNDVHVAYVDVLDRSKVHYKVWDAETNTITTDEIAMSSTLGVDSNIYSVSLDINGSGVVGIAAREWKYFGGLFTGRVYFSERTSGVWTTVETVLGGGNFLATTDSATGISLKYRSSDSQPRILVTGHSETSVGLYYFRKVASVWQSANTLDGSNTFFTCSLVLVGTDFGRAVGRTSTTVEYYTAGSGETSWSAAQTISSLTGTNYQIQADKVETNVVAVGYQDGVAVKVTRLGAGTTTHTAIATGASFRGLAFSDDTIINAFAMGSSGEEKFVSHTSSPTVVTNSTTGGMDLTYYAGDRALHDNIDASGHGTLALCYFGVNADEVVVRRFAYTGYYESNSETDADLTSWDTFEVIGQINGGYTIAYSSKSDSSPVTGIGTTITNGTIVNTDNTKIYANFSVDFTMTDFVIASVDSIRMNYVGTGAGPQVPTACVFDNEIYFSVCWSGIFNEDIDTDKNNIILRRDQYQKWQTQIENSTFMSRYRGSLYFGASDDDKIHIMNEGAYLQISDPVVISKEDLLGSLELKKEVFKIYLILKKESGPFTFSYRVDSFESSSAEGSDWVDYSFNAGPDDSSLVEVPYVSGPFKSIQFKIVVDKDSGLPVKIIGFVVVHGYLGLR